VKKRRFNFRKKHQQKIRRLWAARLRRDGQKSAIKKQKTYLQGNSLKCEKTLKIKTKTKITLNEKTLNLSNIKLIPKPKYLLVIILNTNTNYTAEMEVDGSVQSQIFSCEMGREGQQQLAKYLGDFFFLEKGQFGLPGEAPPKPYYLVQVKALEESTGKSMDPLSRGSFFKGIILEMPIWDRQVDDDTDILRVSSKSKLDLFLKQNNRRVLLGENGPAYVLSVESVERRNNAKGTIYNPAFKVYDSQKLEAVMAKDGVKKVDPITKRGNSPTERIPTGVYVLTFDSQTLPKEIKTGYFNMPVREYYDNPMQCNQCLQLNHTKKWCPNGEVCFSCGEKGHKGTDCKKVRCVNCLVDDDHVSRDRNCPMYKFEKRVNIYSQKNNVSKAATRSYAFHTVTKAVAIENDPELRVTYADQLKAFKNRGAQPVQVRPSPADAHRHKDPKKKPMDTQGRVIESLENVQTSSYIETLTLAMMVTRKRRLPTNPANSSATKGMKSNNRTGPHQPPGPIKSKKQKNQTDSEVESSEDESQMDTDKNASTRIPSDVEVDLDGDDFP